jgi:hypothetical protein
MAKFDIASKLLAIEQGATASAAAEEVVTTNILASFVVLFLIATVIHKVTARSSATVIDTRVITIAAIRASGIRAAATDDIAALSTRG